ncbi:MAG: hypothetical protein KDA63_10505 [Planctomycetales bacterium]|nr:hypothetical protein [Planctomycetales bacterium]
MNKPLTSPSIVEAIRAAYGDLERPNYAFTKKRYKTLIRHDFVADLMATYFVKDDTDLNDHVAVHLRVRDNHCVTLQLCLSLVSNFAMAFRYDSNGLLYSEVVDGSTADLTDFEREILNRLEKYGFRVLCKSEAAVPIEMNLFNTDANDARVYHAVISDSGLVPDVLR